MAKTIVFALWFNVASYPMSIWFKDVIPFFVMTVILSVLLTFGTVKEFRQ